MVYKPICLRISAVVLLLFQVRGRKYLPLLQVDTEGVLWWCCYSGKQKEEILTYVHL